MFYIKNRFSHGSISLKALPAPLKLILLMLSQVDFQFKTGLFQLKPLANYFHIKTENLRINSNTILLPVLHQQGSHALDLFHRPFVPVSHASVTVSQRAQ